MQFKKAKLQYKVRWAQTKTKWRIQKETAKAALNSKNLTEQEKALLAAKVKADVLKESLSKNLTPQQKAELEQRKNEVQKNVQKIRERIKERVEERQQKHGN